jgi:hypothetical protein
MTKKKKTNNNAAMIQSRTAPPGRAKKRNHLPRRVAALGGSSGRLPPRPCGLFLLLILLLHSLLISRYHPDHDDIIDAPPVTSSYWWSGYHLPRMAPRGVSASPLSDFLISAAERLLPPDGDDEDDVVYDENENDDVIDDATTLDIVRISSMRVRDIKRRLARRHGYDARELNRMIDKRDLINALSFEEHKARKRTLDGRRWGRYRAVAIYTCLSVLIVTFWPLMRRVVEVGHVNFVVYAGECLSSWPLLYFVSRPPPSCTPSI